MQALDNYFDAWHERRVDEDSHGCPRRAIMLSERESRRIISGQAVAPSMPPSCANALFAES